MARAPLTVARRAIDAAVGAVPGSVVERVSAAGAPLSRYSGRTRAGAAALASALAALTHPPRHSRRRLESISVDGIAAEIGRADGEVRAWADAGVLGAPRGDGSFGPDALERAELIDFAVRRGASPQEIENAARAGRLELLALEWVVAGDATLTGRDVAARAGVPLELAVAVWQAFGFPAGDVDERRFSRQEVQAMRVIGALRSVFTEDDLVEAASVVGRAMSEVSVAAVELFRRRVTGPFVEAGLGELEVALRLAAMAELMIPPLEPVLQVAFRRHLQGAVQSEAALRLEESTRELSDVTELGVGFADLVGFTRLSETMSPLELGELAARLLRAAEGVFAGHGVRTVKSIGDAVMFTARDPVDCCNAALDLAETAAGDPALPPVRVGVAYGPVLRAYADYFGRTVNIAARLCDAARPQEVLFHAAPGAVDPDAWTAAALVAHPGKRLALKGIRDRVPTLLVRRRA